MIRMSERRIHLLAVLSIIILGLIIYINSIGGAFIRDGGPLVRDNIYKIRQP